MFSFVADTLRAHPEVAIFITLAIGYWIGAMKFKSFSLGAVTGTLLTGVVIGQLGIEISGQVKSVFFLMFLFAVGYGVGPQFVRGVARDGAPQALFAVVICALALGCAVLPAMLAGYGPGLAAGLYAGSQTISASIGLATDAINGLDLEDAQKTTELNHIAVAYAITYLFGTIGTGWILAFLGPKMLNVNLKDECKRFEATMGGGANNTIGSAWHQHELRAFAITDANTEIIGKTVAQAEELLQARRVFIERIRRDGQIIEFVESTELKSGDILGVSGERSVLIDLEAHASEVEDRELIDIPVEKVNAVITNSKVNGRTLEDLAGEKFARGVYLTAIHRGSVGLEIPLLPKTVLQRGDVIEISGTRRHIDAISQTIGFIDRPKTETDMVMVGVAIFLGGLLGSIVLPIGGIPVTLSTSGGTLVFGIIFGWLHSFKPQLGGVPQSTLWFMNSVGLNIFIAVVGISAGPSFISGLQDAGISLFFFGLFATAGPMLLAPYIGKYIFRFDPAINLGICGGARTSTASVAMVGEVAQSNVPMLGYTVPYAVSNTLLTLWGLAIVLIIS